MITLVLTAALLGQIAQNICDICKDVETTPARIELLGKASGYGRNNSADTFELFIRVPVSDEELSALAAAQNEDGSFSDIDYNDPKRSGWDPLQHAMRVERLAIRYVRTGDEKALEIARNGIKYWGDAMPVCSNWWYNEIGIPRQFANAAILLRDKLTAEEMDAIIRILSKSSIKLTGQNKVWEAGSVLIKGILTDDEQLVREAREAILSEMVVSDNEEGLQKDWSFHQHGPQLQFGNYGLSFAVTQCWWSRAFAGTELAPSKEQDEALRNYITKGLGRVTWKGHFDLNASGRQIFKDNQTSKAICVENAAHNLGITDLSAKWGSFYPLSDFGVYQGNGWYASIRMQSERVLGFETTNNENMRGWFSSDGALLVRRTGTEYLDIAPVWNWRHIPGVTSWDDGTQPWGSPQEGFKAGEKVLNHSARVGGETRGRRMTIWMEVNRDGLKARKIWIFFPGGIVCLGAGIEMNAVEPTGEWKVQPGNDISVVTCVEQNLLNGAVEEGEGWINHNGTTYISLDGQKFKREPVEHKGTWGDIAPFYEASDSTSANMFEICIEHGKLPVKASYAYAVVPDGGKAAKAARKLQRRVRIIENSADRQVVRIGLKKYIFEW